MTVTSSANPPTTLRRATATMAVGTLLSRVTGVGRIVALGYALGTGVTSGSPADAYNLSNTIPNIVQDLVLGGILSATFIPVFVARLATRDEDDAWEAISAVVSVTLVVLAVASVVFLAAAPLIVDGLTVLRHSASERKVATYLLILFVPQLGVLHVRGPRRGALERKGPFRTSDVRPDREQRHHDRRVDCFLRRGAPADARRARIRPSRAHIAGPGNHRRGCGAGSAPPAVAAACGTPPQIPPRLAARGGRHDPQIVGVDVRTGRHEPDRPSGRPSPFQQDPRRNLGVHVRVHVLPAAVRGGRHLGHERSHARAGRTMGAGRSGGFPQEMGRRPSWHPRDRPARRGRSAHPRQTSGSGPARLPPSSPASTTPTAQALAMLSLGLPGFCIFLYTVRGFQAMQDLRTAFWLYVVENGLNVALAIVLVGPIGVRGVALSISAAYTIAGLVGLLVLRARLGGLDWAVVARPLGRVALATVALVAAAAIGSNLSASQSPLGLAGRVVAGTVLGSVAYLVVAFAVGALEHRNRQSRQVRRP